VGGRHNTLAAFCKRSSKIGLPVDLWATVVTGIDSLLESTQQLKFCCKGIPLVLSLND
jgi:hypothetical protein